MYIYIYIFFQSCMNVALLAENAKNLNYLLKVGFKILYSGFQSLGITFFVASKLFYIYFFIQNKDNLVFYMPLALGLVLSIFIQVHQS